MRSSGAEARIVLAIALPAVVVGCGIAYGSKVAEVTIAVAIAFAVGCVIVSARDPRRAGVNTTAVILAATVATGVRAAGPVPVSSVIPSAVLALTLLPGVCRGSSTRRRELWGLAIVSVLSIGGIIATAAGGGSLTAIGGFIISTFPVVIALWRLNPDREEIQRLVTGLVAGVAISTFLGIVALRYPSGRAVGLTHHPNQFSLQIAVAVPLLALLWAGGTARTWLCAVLLIVFIVGDLQSGSRSGALALGLVAVVLLWRTVRPLALLGVALVLVSAFLLFGAPLAASPTISRITQASLTQNSDTTRIALADKGLQQVRLDPVFGTGLPKTALPHNVILLVWGGMGFIGLLALFVLLWFVASGSLGTPRGREHWLLSLSALGFLVVVSLNNSIGTPLAWAVLGLLQVGAVRAQRVPASAAVGEVGPPLHLRQDVLA
jgi:hypothetical protein